MTREEALKIVRENYPHFGTTEPWLDLEKALATLIPELRESEDERIRKELIGMVKFHCADEHLDRYLNWLEKQKELPTNDEMLRTLRAEYEKGVADTIAKYEQEEQKPEDRFKEAREKYQVEWSEEDYHWEGLVQLLRDYQKTIDRNSNNMTYEDVECYICWVNSLRPQPKVELSEDVKKTLDEVSHILVGLNYKQIAKDYKQAVEKLLSLRPQPKVELTELDKNILEAAIAFVEQNDHFNYLGGVNKHTVLSALRSLNPHWKPSEEQMEALEYVIRDYREDSCNATANYLQEILDHLKNM